MLPQTLLYVQQLQVFVADQQQQTFQFQYQRVWARPVSPPEKLRYVLGQQAPIQQRLQELQASLTAF
jgi:hypothetical protein